VHTITEAPLLHAATATVLQRCHCCIPHPLHPATATLPLQRYHCCRLPLLRTATAAYYHCNTATAASCDCNSAPVEYNECSILPQQKCLCCTLPLLHAAIATLTLLQLCHCCMLPVSPTHPLSLAQLSSNLVGYPALVLCFMYSQRFLQGTGRQAVARSTQAACEQSARCMEQPCRKVQSLRPSAWWDSAKDALL
jgi:hypothetical protein